MNYLKYKSNKMNKILLIIILFFIWTLDVQSQTDSINSEKIQQRGLFKVLNIKRIKNKEKNA